jgi:hypothetical protein
MKQLLTSLWLVVGISVAQETATPEWLKKIDRNGDSKISREEMPKVFDQIDMDKDGVATVAEVTAHFAKTQGKAPAAPSNPPANPNEPDARGALPDTVEKRAVTIWSDGTRMAGDLYLPKNRQEGEKLPAIVFCAGTGGTKGGTGGRLGPIFAEKGYVALAFDYRGWGESESQLMAAEPQPKPDEKGELTINSMNPRLHSCLIPLLLSCALGASMVQALAQTASPDRFKQLDKNSDDKLSQDEFPYPYFYKQHDTDGDGLLSPDEAAQIKPIGKEAPASPVATTTPVPSNNATRTTTANSPATSFPPRSSTSSMPTRTAP